MNNFVFLQKKYIDIFELYAKEFFANNFDTEKTLFESMKYSFFAGGKRVRPVLLLATADMLGLNLERALPFALALECVHTYSLIHDDLPAMDNDDYRRGRLTNHKVYGDACAILSGDALLNLAFSICLNECCSNPDIKTCKAAKLLADFAGFEGMIAGQSLDIISEGQNSTCSNDLFFIEKNKTGKLIAASLLIPCLMADADFDLFSKIGFALGQQFQIIDDILDVESSSEVLGKTVGKDKQTGKLTYVSLFGIDCAKEKAVELHETCVTLLNLVDGSQFLREYCDLLLNRIS